MRGLLQFAFALSCLSCDSTIITIQRGGAGGSAAQSSTSTSAPPIIATSAVCGDGVVDGGECCDDGSNNGTPGDPCNKDCTCRPCSDQKIFARVVSNPDDPTMPIDPPNIKSVWAYNGIKGYQAGVQMCRAIGADHPCDFTEVVAADQKGELAGVAQDLTFWLHRTTNAMDDLQPNKPCTQDSDCDQLAGDAASVCDPAHKLCAFQPGPGGRCNDWTYPTDHIANGEWCQPANAPNLHPGGVTCGDAFCQKMGGTMSYHIDRNTAFDGVPPPKGCKNDMALGCSGGCFSGYYRAILCCYTPCK